MNPDDVTIFDGGSATDERGKVSFVNPFTFRGVKRFYQLENNLKNPIRAFHGHMKEAKYIYVVSGSIILCLIPIDIPKNPSKQAAIKKIFLTDKNPQVVYVPPKFANGFKVLEKQTKIIVFSTMTLEESLQDDYKYPNDYWGKDIWEEK